MTHEFDSSLIYSVYYPAKDLAALFHGPLYTAKKSITENKRAVSKSGNAFISGVESEYKLSVNRHTLRWKLKAGAAVLQKSYPHKGGYYIITRSFSGNIISRSVFRRGHKWARTAYFEQGNTVKPAVVFSIQDADSGTLEMLEYDRSKHMYEKTILYPCLTYPGTQINSILDSSIGKPVFYLASNSGDFCYYREKSLAEKRIEMTDKLRLGEIDSEPKWKKDTSFSAEWIDEQEQIDVGDNYRYRGETNADGERHGRGRTEQKNGMTAYEGDYYHGKRNGKGAYYYFDGSFCYFGGWKNNERSGIGVTVKKDSDAIHVGQWNEGTLCGPSAVFNENGVIKSFGNVADGKMNGLKVSFEKDGKIYVGNWQERSLTGIGSIYRQNGTLMYSGEIKDGLRDGFGAAFKENGRMECAGQWKNDLCPIKFYQET